MVLYPAVRARRSPPLGRRGADLGRRLRHRRRAAREPRSWPLAEPREDVAEVRDVDADGVPCRLYRPAAARDGVVVHVHGGGFVFHDLDVHDGPARRLANRCGVAVLSVDYRRPPEHRFPAAPDDVSTVVRWLDRARRRARARRPDVRPRRQRRRQPRAGGGAAAPRALPRCRAAVPVPGPDGGLRLVPDRGRRLRRARRRLVLAAVRRVPGRPGPPRPGAAATPTGCTRCRRRS